MKDYTEQEIQEFVGGLRDFATWVERNHEKLDGLSVYHDFYMTLTVTDYVRDPETLEYGTVIKEDETKKRLKDLLEVIGDCKKQWNHGSLAISKNFGGHVGFRANLDRNVVCKKKVTGTRVIPQTIVPERIEEEYEWECQEPSLMKLVEGV